MITLLLARADNGVIGREGDIPWHIPGEQRRFKTLTMGRPMIMGRKTFEGFPVPLPGRRHIVLTRDPFWRADGAEVVHTVAEALEVAGGDVSVIGGAEIYALFRNRADRIELTEVHCEPDGDALVPAFDDWRELARQDLPACGGAPGYSFVTLVR